MTLATGKMEPVRCEKCKRRLFDGIMFGVIKCKCGWLNRFLAKPEKLEYITN